MLKRINLNFLTQLMKSWFRDNWTYCIPGILFLLAMMILPYACPNDSSKGDNKNNNDIKIENGN